MLTRNHLPLGEISHHHGSLNQCVGDEMRSLMQAIALLVALLLRNAFIDLAQIPIPAGPFLAPVSPRTDRVQLFIIPPRTLKPTNNGRNVPAHYEYMGMYPLALQSTSFVIPGDPATFSQQKLPQRIGAVRIDRQIPSSLYRVVIGVRSLTNGVYSLLIQRVLLVIEQVSPAPHPLRVWLKSSPLNYQTNPYLARYSGQGKGETLSAIYTPVPYANVQLAPGEADQLAIQIASQRVVAVRFHIQFLYRLAQESVVRTLTRPDSFEVVFSDASNWNAYMLQSGHLVPISA